MFSMSPNLDVWSHCQIQKDCDSTAHNPGHHGDPSYHIHLPHHLPLPTLFHLEHLPVLQKQYPDLLVLHLQHLHSLVCIPQNKTCPPLLEKMIYPHLEEVSQENRWRSEAQTSAAADDFVLDFVQISLQNFQCQTGGL